MMIKAWSATTVQAFENCPRQLKYRKIDRFPEEKGPALIKGNRVHKEGELYLKGVTPFPSYYRYVKKEMQALRRAKAVSEEKWGFDRDWESHKFFGDDVWLRMILDVRVNRKRFIRIVDFKTGKEYTDKHDDQMGLYAVGTFARFPETPLVLADLWYLDTGKIIQLKFNRKEAAEEREQWEVRAQKVLDEKDFDPTPSRWACRLCAFGKSKGGPCKVEKL